MKLEINNKYCIRCGVCEDLYPELFKRNYETHCIDVIVDDVPSQLEERAKKAVEDCAIAMISLK